MPSTIRIPGWPLLFLDTPEERAEKQRRRQRYRARLPVLMEITMDEKLYRVRELNAIESVGHVTADFLYNGNWYPVKNYEILSRLRELLDVGK